jgi:hypothetical protein
MRRAVAATLVLAACVLGPQGAAASHSTRASASAAKPFTLYSAVDRKLYINNVDDLDRGRGHNPFGNFTSVPAQKNERAFGPFPGDEGVFSFGLYRDAALKTKAGSAVVICWYGFVQNAFCDASFDLADGSLIAKGTFNFNSPASAFSIVGGFEKYKRARGLVQVAALGVGTQAQPVFRPAPILQKQRLAFTLVPPAAADPKRLAAYSNPTHQAYVANADDETRGAVSNPFGVHLSRAAAGLTATKGPYAGDETLFSFLVYSDAGLRTKVGSSVYTCQYAFEQDAFCDVSFQLARGTFFAAGIVNFNAKRFTLAVTGGYGAYSGLTGEVAATPIGKYAQKLAFAVG